MTEPNFFNRNVKPFITQCLYLKQQRTITLFLFLCVTLMFAMRMSLSMAIIEINNNLQLLEKNYLKLYCPGEYISVCNGTGLQVSWTEFQIGLIFSIYYLGYTIGHVPGVLITLSHGGKAILCIGIAGSSILNMCLPIVIMSNNFKFTLLVQFLIGLFHGTKMPAVTDLLANWIPKDEQIISIRFVFSGILVGSLIGPLGTGISIYLAQTWTVMFYVFGIIGIIYIPAFMILCYDYPEIHPYISEREKQHLNQSISINRSSADRLSKTPWRRLLLSRSAIALIPAQFGHDYVYYAFCTYLPKYAAEILHLNLLQVTAYATVVFFLLILVVLLTSLSFRYLPSCYSDKYTKIRMGIFNIASYVPSLFFVAGTVSECNTIAAIIWFTTAISISGFCHPEIRGTIFELNKTYACVLISVINFFSGLFASIVFITLGTIVNTKSVTEWMIISFLSFMTLNTSSTVYIIWSTAKPDSFQTARMKEIQNALFQYSLEREEDETHVT